jgi:hypothetical protein
MDHSLPNQDLDPTMPGELDRLAQIVLHRLSGRVLEFCLSLQGGRLVLRGRAPTYYAKQLAQHAVMAVTAIPILANEIEVRASWQNLLAGGLLMSEHTTPNRPAVAEDLARAHRALLDDLRRLEDAARPSAEEGLEGLRARLAATRAHLAEHFRFEEEDGYLDAVRQSEPRLERAVEHLAEEHRSLMQTLDALLALARGAAPPEDRLREGLRQWVKEVRKHEARENDLVQDAFTQDIGTKD